jgi:hypothetical protein
METRRFDIYSTFHKLLRSRLYETSVRLGRADYASPGAAGEELRYLLETLSDLEAHAAHEEAHVHPVLRARAPSVARTLDDAHTSLAATDARLHDALAELDAARGEVRAALGAELYRAFNVFAAAHLTHMDFEEREANAALWASYSDAEIVAVHGRLLASVPPASMARYVGGMLLVVNPTERAAITRSAPAVAPAGA